MSFKRTAVVLLLSLMACRAQPALLEDQQSRASVRALQVAFSQSVDAEKSAVLATTDEDSEAFAAESRAAAARVDALRVQLGQIQTRPTSVVRLKAFDKAWASVVAIDARILPLAVANTNLKAAKLSAQDAFTAVNRFVDALSVIGEKSTEPSVLREVSRASVAALRIEALHAPHIAAAEDLVMTALETRTSALALEVNQALEKLGDRPTAKQPTSLPLDAWSEFERLTAEIFRLSRVNSNVISFELSTHGKRQATIACQHAIEALAADLQEAPSRSTR